MRIAANVRTAAARRLPDATRRGRSPTIRTLPPPVPTTKLDARIALVVSRYNAAVTDALREGALRAYAARGGDPSTVLIAPAPGAYELTAVCLAAAERPEIAGVVALGCIVQGETIHDEVLAHAVAKGLTDVTLKTGKPVGFGVLTVRDAEQARARAGGEHGNKGEDAMHALLDAIATIDHLRGDPQRVSLSQRRAPDKTRSQTPGQDA